MSEKKSLLNDVDAAVLMAFLKNVEGVSLRFGERILTHLAFANEWHVTDGKHVYEVNSFIVALRLLETGKAWWTEAKSNVHTDNILREWLEKENFRAKT